MPIGTGFFDSNRYDSVRSSYSPLVLTELNKIFSSRKSLCIAEIGAGSGKFTECLLNSNLDITELHIVEPDKKGIEIHKDKFSENQKVPIFYHNNFSHETELGNNSVDIIFVAHAFHWFDIQKTRIEFNRILKKQGQVFILGKFLDENDIISSKYICCTRFGKRKNGFANNIEAYSLERMSYFFGHKVEKKDICTEIEIQPKQNFFDEIEIRIDSCGDKKLKEYYIEHFKKNKYDMLSNNNSENEIIKKILDFYSTFNENDNITLKYNTFYFLSSLIV